MTERTHIQLLFLLTVFALTQICVQTPAAISAPGGPRASLGAGGLGGSLDARNAQAFPPDDMDDNDLDGEEAVPALEPAFDGGAPSAFAAPEPSVAQVMEPQNPNPFPWPLGGRELRRRIFKKSW